MARLTLDIVFLLIVVSGAQSQNSEPAEETQQRCRFDARVTALKILNVELNNKNSRLTKNNLQLMENAVHLNNEINRLKKQLDQMRDENRQLDDENRSLKLLTNENATFVNLQEGTRVRCPSSDEQHQILRHKLAELDHENQELKTDYEDTLLSLQHDKDVLEQRLDQMHEHCGQYKDDELTICNCSTESYPFIPTPDHHNETYVANVTDLRKDMKPVDLFNSIYDVLCVTTGFWGKLEGGLKIGQQIDIYGEVSHVTPVSCHKIGTVEHTKSAEILLWNIQGTSKELIFYLKPRFDHPRDTTLVYGWKNEVNEAPYFPLVREQKFHITIVCEQTHFKVLLNNIEFLTYEYKSNISSINTIEVSYNVRFDKVVYTS